MTPIDSPRVAVVSLRAANLPITAHFYRDVIGLHLLPHHDHHPAFDLGSGIILVIVQGHLDKEGNSQTERFPVIAFAVDDLDSAVEWLKAHGVELPWGVEESPKARWVMFFDPAGNLIEFAQFTRPT